MFCVMTFCIHLNLLEHTIVINFGASNYCYYVLLLLCYLFSKDALNSSKVVVKTFKLVTNF